MSELIQRVKCPMGCVNSIFTEQTKIINEGNNDLLLEGQPTPQRKIKIYTCQCCGNIFEMQDRNSSGRFVL